ncbi:MAG: AmmeMemoRadiSam system protein B [Chitinispirillaceae bacterium]|nr:AmmeMemoRadiSam system protein B [Chitinispirillaceae bacterium]
MGIFNGDSSAGESVRKPAVAGQFYPGSAGELRSEVEKYLAGGAALPAAPRMLISPHAGYVFSGPVAGKGFATIDKNTKTVIILGPPHRAPVRGIAVPSCAWFETPLGKVEVDRERIRKLMKNPAAYQDDRAHEEEHSLEVQIPFLQVRLASFTIVPLLVHGIDPRKAADMLSPLMDEKTLVVASSDFSHYLSQEEARKTDDASVASILDCREDGAIDACGELPVRVVMALAKKSGLAPKLLDKRTSYETAPRYGDGDRVVGYASIVYLPGAGVDKDASVAAPSRDDREGLGREVREFLLKLARSSLEASVKGEKLPEPADVPGITRENRGCFVTLTARGELRGCIGYIEPIKPLYRAVIENAENAALSDPRFPRVTPKELPSITIEVSVLTKPVPLAYKDPRDLLDKLEPGADGVILQSGFHSSTYLPQVWEHFSGDRVRFLESLSMKGGMPPDGWKTANVKRYRAEHFSE